MLVAEWSRVLCSETPLAARSDTRSRDAYEMLSSHGAEPPLGEDSKHAVGLIRSHTTSALGKRKSDDLGRRHMRTMNLARRSGPPIFVAGLLWLVSLAYRDPSVPA